MQQFVKVSPTKVFPRVKMGNACPSTMSAMGILIVRMERTNRIALKNVNISGLTYYFEINIFILPNRYLHIFQFPAAITSFAVEMVHVLRKGSSAMVK